MPSKKAAIEWLKFEVEKGRGDEPCHIIDIKAEEKKRIENTGPKPATKFVIETDSPEMYSALHVEKDRIIKHCGNKSVAIGLMLRAWRDALSNAELDKVLAQLEVEEGREGPPPAEMPNADDWLREPGAK